MVDVLEEQVRDDQTNSEFVGNPPEDSLSKSRDGCPWCEDTTLCVGCDGEGCETCDATGRCSNC